MLCASCSGSIEKNQEARPDPIGFAIGFAWPSFSHGFPEEEIEFGRAMRGA